LQNADRTPDPEEAIAEYQQTAQNARNEILSLGGTPTRAIRWELVWSLKKLGDGYVSFRDPEKGIKHKVHENFVNHTHWLIECAWWKEERDGYKKFLGSSSKDYLTYLKNLVEERRRSVRDQEQRLHNAKAGLQTGKVLLTRSRKMLAAARVEKTKKRLKQERPSRWSTRIQQRKPQNPQF
jgi:hypothetical protein